MISSILEICQWDFLSYDQATRLSPDGKDYIFYKKRHNDPNTMHQLRISTDPFGFYNWIPSCAEDLALVREYKIKPKLWTAFEIPPSQEPCCLMIEHLLQHRGLNAGVACLGQKNGLPLFVVAIARSTPQSLGRYVSFQLQEEALMESQYRQDLRLHYLDSVVCQILGAL